MDRKGRIIKRLLDLVGSTIGLVLLAPFLLILILAARIDTRASGIFTQTRIGRNAKPFTLYKLRTMRKGEGGFVTAKNDPRITGFGSLLRRAKLDELPQLWNVMLGQMSLVGPRPDMPGYLDRLTGAEQRLWQLRPGITGPASLHFRDEELLLAQTDNPQAMNDTVIWPQKVRINLDYLDHWSFGRDLGILKRTLFP